MGGFMDWFWGIVAIVGSVGAIGFLMWQQRNPDDGRTREDDEREFFDAHGHWPDQAPDAIDAQVATATATARAATDATRRSAAHVIEEDAPPPPPPWWRRLLHRLTRRGAAPTA